MMVNGEPPVKSEVIVVLAGDWRGGRILHAAKLLQDGYAPKVLVSGPRAFYDIYEDETAIAYAVRRGYPVSYFEAFRHKATSTETETIAILDELRKRGIHKALIVTSNYHTRRARRLFEQNATDDIETHVTASPDVVFHSDSWWKSREGQKTWLMEFTKLITSPFGI